MPAEDIDPTVHRLAVYAVSVHLVYIMRMLGITPATMGGGTDKKSLCNGDTRQYIIGDL